jgi:hypothetical protein
MTEVKRKKDRAGEKIVKFARKISAVEGELGGKLRSKEIDGIAVKEAFYRGFLEPAVNTFIDKYYKLPAHQTCKNGIKYMASYFFKWSGLETLKRNTEGRFNTEKNAFKCNILSTRAMLWRRTNHCVNRSVSFPTLLAFKLKNALSRWKSRLKIPRI